MELLDTSISSIQNSFSVVIKSDDKHAIGSTDGLHDNAAYNEKILILAAFSVNDHAGWVESLGFAIRSSVQYSDTPDKQSIVSRLFNSSEELLNNNLRSGSTDLIGSSSTQISAQHNRSNALSHVCWHRNISICAGEVVDKEAHSLSGPLLRKFKNR